MMTYREWYQSMQFEYPCDYQCSEAWDYASALSAGKIAQLVARTELLENALMRIAMVNPAVDSTSMDYTEQDADCFHIVRQIAIDILGAKYDAVIDAEVAELFASGRLN